MADFRYTARTVSGDRVTGVIEAESEAAVLRTLGERSLFPVEVEGQAKAPAAARRRIRPRDLGVLYGQLADLLESGVPLLRSLESLIRSSRSRQLRELLQSLRDQVADGSSLTDALREHPEVFPPLHVAMVQAGERASFLEQVFSGLGVFIERLDDLRSKVRGALIYPALLSVMGTVILFAALIFFVPRFEPLLQRVEKPLPTQVLFALSGLVRHYWFLLLLGGTGAVALLVSALRSQKGQEIFEVWRLKIPVAGHALRMVAITRFARILGTMLANGVPMLQALAIAKDATGSRLLGERIAEAAESVRAGDTLTGPLSKGDFFPPQILSMIAVAEESNQLEKVLIQIADTIERRTHHQVDQAVRLVEPVILCLVTGAIGFLALGLLLPIFTLAGSLGAK